MEKIKLKGYIPKKETQQDQFLQQYPEFDGRGLLIAIIDTGVDVSLEGLQKTSTGLPKIIDCFDFSESGNVDTSTIKNTSENDRNLVLSSGREIKIPQNWKNPSDEWHLGIKSIQEILPNDLKNNQNSKEKIKKQEYKMDSQKSINKAFSEIQIFDENGKIDCIVWNNGQKWQTCIISDSVSENLENAKVLTNFRDEHEYCFILDKISCCVKIQNDGNLLQLIIPYSDHGSCVAQVAASHFPEDPERDGIAPGAQIISINVYRETDNLKKVFAMEKTLNKCIELGVNIVNLSCTRNEFKKSSIITLFKKMINEHGIIVTQSAGNLGPFITSMRWDNNECNDEMLTIGAGFTLGIKNIFEKHDDYYPMFVWHYSSKGPITPRGARGVTLTAPSDAIIDNPKWHSSKKELFSGTSCASPIAAGTIACLLSGLKTNSIKYSPATLKLALSNTANLPDEEDRLGFGNGIIQIFSAFEYFQNFKEQLPKIPIPKISLAKSNENGIILYKLRNLSFINKYRIKVEHRNQIPCILKLVPETHKHIQHSETVSNKSFNVKIDAKNLNIGSFIYSEIQGFDPSNPSLGAIFHLPITVIVPEKAVNYCIQKEVIVKSPSKFHYIIDPPKYTCKCTVKLVNPENGIIKFEKVVTQRSQNCYGEKFVFEKCEESYDWCIDIRWEKIFQVCIYQKNFLRNGSELKTLLKIDFEKY